MLASLTQISTIVSTVISAAEAASATVNGALPYLALLKKLFSKDTITVEDINKTEASLAELHARIQAPLPPEED